MRFIDYYKCYGGVPLEPPSILVYPVRVGVHRLGGNKTHSINRKLTTTVNQLLLVEVPGPRARRLVPRESGRILRTLCR